MTPLIGIPAGVKIQDSFPVHTVSEKYLLAVVEGTGGLPVIVPALGAERMDMADLARRLDGLLLTGGLSNVEPHRYGGGPSRPDTPHDRARDSTVLPLIRACLDEGVPVFAICRGLQELNVALGGTLHQHVHELDGKHDHRSDKTKAWHERYAHAHAVTLTPGGFLARALGTTEAQVNSLHGQGIDRLAPRPPGRGPGARRPDRGGQGRGRGLRHGRPMARRVSEPRRPGLQGAVRRLRQGRPRPRRSPGPGDPEGGIAPHPNLPPQRGKEHEFESPPPSVGEG